MTTPYYQDDAVTIWHGDALALPIPDESVDLIVTSPPYFGLRSYTDSGQHYAGQIGSEATPGEFVDALIAATREMVRVLKPSGSIWVNLGDKYAQTVERSRNGEGVRRTSQSGGLTGKKSYLGGGTVELGLRDNGVRAKSLIGVPWRYALRCIDDLGLILRAEIIWSKPNGLPEPVTDRVRRSHEQWFHLTREPRYFAAVDEIREQFAEPNGRPSYGRERPPAPGGNRGTHVGRMDHAAHRDMGQNPLGKLPGSVWDIPTQPLVVPPELGIDHFAAFPMELPRRIIRGWSPSGICVECGEGRRPVIDYTPEYAAMRGPGTDWNAALRSRTGGYDGSGDRRVGTLRPVASRLVTGYACACPEPSAQTSPSVVLDPFGGAGTVALVARTLGRIGWHVDLSKDYCRLARWRVTDPGERARAMDVPKPEPVAVGQGSLLDLIGGAS